MESLVQETDYTSLIYEVRGSKVMLDSDLARLYGVETRRLKEQVRRNIDRFPEDFMFIITKEELRNLRSQFATSSWGGSRHGHMAFTEHGVAMLSGVLNSKRAIAVNIRIIRIFIKMRMFIEAQKEIMKKLDALEKKDLELDEKVAVIFDYLRQLEQVRNDEEDFKNHRRIGFSNDR